MKGFKKQNKSKNKRKDNNYHDPTIEELINHAIKLHVKGNILEASKYYQYCLNQGFNDHRVLSNYGLILKGVGKLKEAESLLRKAIEVNPNSTNSHHNLGIVLHLLGNLQEAVLSQRKAIELNPDFAEAHSILGNIFRDLGRLDEAESSQRKAIELNPDFAGAHSNLGNIFRDMGRLKEAVLSQRKAIELNPDFAEAHYNLGNMFRELGRLKDAELSHRKVIELNPDFAEAHSSLGKIFRDLGKLNEAESSQLKAIELNPDYGLAYFSLSMLQYSNKDTAWKNQLFSENILKNNSQEDQVHIYFARSNILHKEKNHKESAQCLKLANNLKLFLNPSDVDTLINNSKRLLIESNKQEINQKEYRESPESIFIVGMPRSGSTLLESIISMNISVNDLGEVNILEESFVEYKSNNQGLTLAELYWKKTNNHKSELNITTNKFLYNYQYAGIIASRIPNAKIIHCYRNPLDNILSIYRENFAKGNSYSSSLIDCAYIYLDQEELMTKYKNRFRSKIYDLNYDSLVRNPNKEIKSLISWLGWEWDDTYLSPHLNNRSVSTASSVQVRSPINSKSIGGWKHYKDMLRPAIEILTQNDRYRDLVS